MFEGNYKERNLFQEYFLEVVELCNQDDGEGIQQLMDELTPEQQNYLYRHFASYTRSKIKSLGIYLKAM